MKLIIDISEELYAKVPTLINKGNIWIGDVIEAVKDGTPLEAQPNRCDSCTHSEEQDGSNCYECVKGMADNFEAQPSEDCISRQAVLDTIGNVPDHNDGMVFEALSHAQRDVALLPSVTPRRIA